MYKRQGHAIVHDLAKMPHVLIAGTTGSGKSVEVNSMIMSILMRATPAEVRFIMVDPKRVEFAPYEGIPHLYVPVVTECREASSALSWAVAEMERRLKMFSKCGVRNIITFDAHDPRVQNSIPLNGFETVQASYQFIKNLLRTEPDLQIDSNHMMVISPDEGGMGRAIYIANVLGLDMGMFYKRRDYTRVVNGRNPIVAHEFLGTSVEGKDMIIIDDMISSGESVLEVASALKQRGARKIFICTTFGLFTSGMEKFDKAYACGNINRVLTTNLIYQPEELLEREWYVNCDMSKYVAYLIDTLNHDTSISDLLDPNDKIQAAVAKYKKGLALDNDD